MEHAHNVTGTTPAPEAGEVDEENHHRSHLYHRHRRNRQESTEDSENLGNDESEALVSERAACTGFPNDNPGLASPRVQFEKIREEGDAGPPAEDPMSDEERKGRRHHHKHDHK